MPRPAWLTVRGGLSALFFVHGVAMAIWFVPLSLMLETQGYASIRPWAFATSAVAALVSPLVFGSLADRRWSPPRVLGLVAIGTAVFTTLITLAVVRRAGAGLVLGLIQLQMLMSVPTWSLMNTLVLGRLSDPQREFGPVRAFGTVGWIAGCWIVSAAKADASVRAGHLAAAIFLLLAAMTWCFRGGVLPPSGPPPTLRERLGLDALRLLAERDHRVVFLTAGLVAIPVSAFYPYTPPHLRDLGYERISAWMSLGQVTEVASMFGLAFMLGRWRLKWIFAAGLGFALLRYLFFAMDGRGWILLGISLHGLAFTLFFVTVPIYLNERIDVRWRARAQALFSLMTQGFGNLVGYLGAGAWLESCRQTTATDWVRFWAGLALCVAAVLGYFLVAYAGRGRARREG